jgi:hypothetical protein
MNSKTLSYLNVLPPRIRQLVYDFDGRYKIAKDKCIELIRQRGHTPVGIRGSGEWKNVWSQINDFKMKTFHSDFPEYSLEIQRRVSMYRSRLESSGHIRGVTTHLKRLPKTYCFNDALGSYTLGMVYDTVIINGKSYKSMEKIHSVSMNNDCRTGTTKTVVKCIDILDPVFKKTIKGRYTQKVKIYRELGVSNIGIPASIYKKVFGGPDDGEGEFGFDEAWYNYRKCIPPASLSAVTDMLTRNASNGLFTFAGKDYKICTKTGTGIVYHGNDAVGYITKKMSMRFTEN